MALPARKPNGLATLLYAGSRIDNMQKNLWWLIIIILYLATILGSIQEDRHKVEQFHFLWNSSTLVQQRPKNLSGLQHTLIMLSYKNSVSSSISHCWPCWSPTLQQLAVSLTLFRYSGPNFIDLQHSGPIINIDWWTHQSFFVPLSPAQKQFSLVLRRLNCFKPDRTPALWPCFSHVVFVQH